MLTKEQVHAVRLRLARGESIRCIREATGVGRGSIALIKHGKWSGLRANRRLDDVPSPYRDICRCPACGAVATLHAVTGQCMACDLRAQPTRRVHKHSDQAVPRLGLTPDDHDRYIQVRKGLGLATPAAPLHLPAMVPLAQVGSL